MLTSVSNGLTIDRYIPPQLRHMFYRNPNRRYMRNNGLDPYGFSTDGLVMYLPLWALKDSAFKSVDAYKRTIAVTGALWQPDGRLFDGDDLIGCGRITEIEGATQPWTILLWVRLITAVGNYPLFTYDANNTLSGIDLYMYWNSTTNVLRYQIGGNQAEKSSTITDLEDNAWHLIGLEHTATNALTYEDGANKDDAAFTGGAFGAGYELKFGDDINLAFLPGEIGEIWVHNRAIGAEAHQDIFNRTAWRYQ